MVYPAGPEELAGGARQKGGAPTVAVCLRLCGAAINQAAFEIFGVLLLAFRLGSGQKHCHPPLGPGPAYVPPRMNDADICICQIAWRLLSTKNYLGNLGYLVLLHCFYS